MVFHRSLSDSKSPQVSRTRLRILANLSNDVVWMAFTRPLISKSSSLRTNHLVTVQSAPIIILLLDNFTYCSLDSLHPSCYFQVLQSLYQSFGDRTNSTNHNWYNHHFHVPQFFQFPSKVEVLIHLFAFFQFYSVVRWDSKVHSSASSLFCCWLL